MKSTNLEKNLVLSTTLSGDAEGINTKYTAGTPHRFAGRQPATTSDSIVWSSRRGGPCQARGIGKYRKSSADWAVRADELSCVRRIHGVFQ